MRKLQTKTVQGIEIRPVYGLVWHGSYSTGEWNEEVFQHFEDDGIKKLQAAQSRLNTLPLIPWETYTPEQYEAKTRACEKYSSYEEAIRLRREILNNLYYSNYYPD